MEREPIDLADPHVVPTRHWTPLADGRIRCDVCPRLCKLREGQRGMCFVRARADDQIVLTTYGRSSGFCVDPIEKKPLNHFLPGTAVLSFGTAGCNLACKFCFHPDAWIATTRGMQRMADLFEGSTRNTRLGEGRVGFPEELVGWTRGAERARVTKVFTRPYSGELVSLKALGCPEIRVTPNHGIFAAHRSEQERIDKVPAGELSTEHFLVVPKRKPGEKASISVDEWLASTDVGVHAPRNRRVPTQELAALLRMPATSRELAQATGYHPAYLRKLRGQLARGALAVTEEPRPIEPRTADGRVRYLGERGSGIPETVSLTPELAWLLGLYCAEGSTTSSSQRPNSHRLVFSLGRHEHELAERSMQLLAGTFGARPCLVNRRTTVTVECGQTSLARLFAALCGNGAKEKQVPPPLLDAPEPAIRAFLDGYLAGDGYRSATHVVSLTVSERLALGLFELGLHLGVMPTYFEHTPPPRRKIEGRTVSQSKYYIVKYLRSQFDPGADRSRERPRWREFDTHFLVPIRRMRREPYRGEVYNLEVDDPDHSYLAPFLAVANCQNWDISKSREIDTLTDVATSQALAETAKRLGCDSIAFTYNDPVVFMEYAIDVADACRERGIKSVAVTAGYMCAEPRRELYRHMDAANVDLKAFTGDFYRRICGGGLDPVLETLVYLKHETDVWFEITTLLIPGANDSDEEIAALAAWVHEHLGPDVPLHFTAFHPDWKMMDRPPTPPATLTRARRIALAEGLHYVYTGNVHDAEGGSTWCPGCGSLLIERDWYRLGEWNLMPDGRCGHFGHRLPGVFAGTPGTWGPRRLPVRLADIA